MWGRIFYKEVFLRLSVCVVYSCDFIVVRLSNYCVVRMLHEHVYVYISIFIMWVYNTLGRGQYSSNRLSGISTRTIHQSTTSSLSQTIWPRWASRQFLTLHIVQTFLPETFAYSLSSEAVVMRQLRRWKRLWRRSLTRSHKRTSMGPSRSFWNGTTNALQPEEIILKGIEFHVCAINKSAHTKKVWKLI